MLALEPSVALAASFKTYARGQARPRAYLPLTEACSAAAVGQPEQIFADRKLGKKTALEVGAHLEVLQVLLVDRQIQLSAFLLGGKAAFLSFLIALMGISC